MRGRTHAEAQLRDVEALEHGEGELHDDGLVELGACAGFVGLQDGNTQRVGCVGEVQGHLAINARYLLLTVAMENAKFICNA